VHSFSSEGLAISEVDYEAGFRMPRHAHPYLSLSLIVRGGVEESTGAKRRSLATPLSIGVKPPGVDHSNAFSRHPTRIVCLQVSPEWRARLDERMPALDEWRWSFGGPALPVFLRLASQLRENPEALRDDLENAAVDLLAALEPVRDETGHPAWMVRVREQLAGEAHAGVTTVSIAREVGIHPVSLARAFRRCYGESISEHVRQARLRAAARLLADRRLSLADVASACGCADQSHLTRLCRRESGLTPGALRRLQTAY
jgi:AraC family transcriptional regulator